jgi:hypothetical protein
MNTTDGLLYLRSGKWRWRAVSTGRDEVLELTDPGRPSDKMRARLPFSWRLLNEDDFRDIARKPDVRLWRDRGGILWRVSVVGPGTPYDFPLGTRHLVFDSSQCWAGIAAFEREDELGDVTSEELLEMRERTSDFGGPRKRLRVT